MKPELIAHRGEPENYPENSIEGYQAVLEAGAGYIETDIQITADNIPILCHDPSLANQTGHDLRIAETAYPEMQGLAAGFPGKFNNRFDHTRIATLNEFAALLKQWPGARAFIEIKDASIDSHGINQVIAIILDAIAGILPQCILISFSHTAVTRARETADLPIGWVLPEWSAENRSLAAALEPQYLFCNRKRLPPEPAPLWEGPWKWVVYTVNDPGEILAYAARGFGMVETNMICKLLMEPALAPDKHG